MSNPRYRKTDISNSVILSPYDNTLVFIVIFLIIIGLLAIFSAGAPKCIMQGASSTFFVARQFTWFILGLLAMFVLSRINYKLYDKIAIPFAWFVIILLLGVLCFWNERISVLIPSTAIPIIDKINFILPPAAKYTKIDDKPKMITILKFGCLKINPTIIRMGIKYLNCELSKTLMFLEKQLDRSIITASLDASDG